MSVTHAAVDASESLYAKQWTVDGPENCHFYHTLDLPGLGTISGDWDLRGRVDEYLGKVDFHKKRVLDIGTASGFLTFEGESRCSADVVSVEADHSMRIQLLPMREHPTIQNYESWVNGADTWLERQKASYWLSHRLLKSRAKAYYGNVYQLPKEIGMFDIVVVAQILVHLRDPIGALMAATERCGDTLIVAEGTNGSEGRDARLLVHKPEQPLSIWWSYSIPLYEEILDILGFDLSSHETSMYRCNAQDRDLAITTMVAKRRKAARPLPSHLLD